MMKRYLVKAPVKIGGRWRQPNEEVRGDFDKLAARGDLAEIPEDRGVHVTAADVHGSHGRKKGGRRGQSSEGGDAG